MKYAILFGLSLSYAVVRYCVFGTVLTANLPCFVTNKAVAVASVLALLAAAFNTFRGRSEHQRSWFAFFKVSLLVHVLLSIFLLSLYDAGKLNLYGELFMLFGVIAVVLLMLKTLVKELTVRPQVLQVVSLGAIALHQFFLGCRGWLAWTEWPGHMPPISMLGFSATLVAMTFCIVGIGSKRE